MLTDPIGILRLDLTTVEIMQAAVSNDGVVEAPIEHSQGEPTVESMQAAVAEDCVVQVPIEPSKEEPTAESTRSHALMMTFKYLLDFYMFISARPYDAKAAGVACRRFLVLYKSLKVDEGDVFVWSP